MILVISWAMMLNIAKLIRDRMKMQNEVDNIVLSISVHKARAMNFTAACNYLIGSLLGMGTKPEFIQIPTYTTNAVAAFPYGDYQKNSQHKALDADVAKLKSAVDALQKAQEAAMISHLVYHNTLMAKYAMDSEYKLIIYPTAPASKSAAEKFFGLKRNTKGITYLQTINTEQKPIPHIVYNPFPLGDLVSLISGSLKDLFEKIGLNAEDTVAGFLGMPSGATKQKVYKKVDYSWYIMDENFSQQKIQAALIKLPSDKNKPLFSKLLGIKYPLITVFSASAIYNADGPMFPSKESDLIGMTDTEPILYAALMSEYGIFISELVSRDTTPYKILSGIVTLYLGARVVERVLKVKSDPETSPINAYNEGKFGGWAAHLIPYKSREENQSPEMPESE
jgi:hypothetical protein